MTEPNQAAAYESGRVYLVRLTRAVTWGRAKFLPLPEHEMNGDVLNDIVAEHGAEVIDSAKPKE